MSRRESGSGGEGEGAGRTSVGCVRCVTGENADSRCEATRWVADSEVEDAEESECVAGGGMSGSATEGIEWNSGTPGVRGGRCSENG
jgi:hypothetical protein